MTCNLTKIDITVFSYYLLIRVLRIVKYMLFPKAFKQVEMQIAFFLKIEFSSPIFMIIAVTLNSPPNIYNMMAEI